jgi:hypothetical protein
MLRRIASSLLFWAALVGWAIWITRDRDHAIAFGFEGGWMWTVIATLLQDLGRRRYQPPLEKRSILSVVALLLLASGITIAVWWPSWFYEPISYLLGKLGFFSLLAVPLIVAWLSGFVYGIPDFERHPASQPD